MYIINKTTKALAIVGISSMLFISPSMAATQATEVSPVTNGVSQKLTGKRETAASLNKLLPTIKYTTKDLSKNAQKVNSATWKSAAKIDRTTGAKLQALLNWHHSGVGAVDGYWGKNTRKAMQAFQQANGLQVTNDLNTETWQALTKDEALMAQPVLVNYELTAEDVNLRVERRLTDGGAGIAENGHGWGDPSRIDGGIRCFVFYVLI